MSFVIHGFPFCEHRDCLAAATSYTSRCCAACAAHDTDAESCAACDTPDELEDWGRRSQALLEELLGFLVGEQPARPAPEPRHDIVARRRGASRRDGCRIAGDRGHEHLGPPQR